MPVNGYKSHLEEIKTVGMWVVYRFHFLLKQYVIAKGFISN